MNTVMNAEARRRRVNREDFFYLFCSAPLRLGVHHLLVVLFSASALAVEIEGVQPAALDQPRVHVHLRRQPNGEALSAHVAGEKSINIQAFLDTGASGILLSKTTADALGVKTVTANRKPVTFHDVGVAGDAAFHVSEPLHVFIAPFGRTGEPDDADGYPISVGPVRVQVGAAAGLMDMLTGGLDVVGMPAIKGRVIVMDPRPVDSFGDTMRAGLFSPRDAKIPRTDRHIAVSYASFDRFTRIEPTGATGPTQARNPFIGPSPTGDGKAPPVLLMHNNQRTTGSWLLDTGAASMISTKHAAALGVTYLEATEGTDKPKLRGAPEQEQFTITIGGIGGARKAAGFFVDTLVLPTRENDPLVYRKAPVLVTDITVTDEKTGQSITLDGVLGMNFFVASAFVEESALMPDIRNMTAGPFEWIVFDEPAGMLGVKLKRK